MRNEKYTVWRKAAHSLKIGESTTIVTPHVCQIQNCISYLNRSVDRKFKMERISAFRVEPRITRVTRVR